jgi:predicted nucleic acid-binding protein
VIVVSNASPLIALGAIGRLELLPQLFGEIFLPEAVLLEVQSVDLRQARWVLPRKLTNDFLLRALEGELDRGESAAIAMAVELKADLLLMDEHRGRQAASRMGLTVLGVLGVLTEAKRRGFVEKVGSLLNDLQTKAGFRVSSALAERVLQEAGES